MAESIEPCDKWMKSNLEELEYQASQLRPYYDRYIVVSTEIARLTKLTQGRHTPTEVLPYFDGKLRKKLNKKLTPEQQKEKELVAKFAELTPEQQAKLIWRGKI